MIKYADRHYYSQQVREIEQCIRQSKGTDTAWARKLISAMQGEKGQGKYMAYQAEEFIKKDQARVDRLIEAVSDLLNHAIAPEPKPKAKPKPIPPLPPVISATLPVKSNRELGISSHSLPTFNNSRGQSK